MVDRNPLRRTTIEAAWRSFRDAMPLHAHRPSFVAGAAWALGRVRGEADKLIKKEIAPEIANDKAD